jgi:hypothetical protein
MHSRELYQESLERTTGLLRTGKSKFKCSMRAHNRGNHCERYRIVFERNSIDTLHTANRVGRWLDCANWALH